MARPLNILQISPRIPWPMTDGSAIGIYNITRHVAARGHRVTFVAFGIGGGGEEGRRVGGTVGANHLDRTGDVSQSSLVDETTARPASPSVRPVEIVGDMPTFCRVEIVAHDTRNTVWKGVRNLFSGDPYPISKYRCPGMYARLDALCAEQRFDLVHVDHAHMTMYGEHLQRRYGLPYLLREHNFETTIYRRLVEQSRFFPTRLYFRMQAARLYRFEARAVSFPDVVAAITPEEAEYLASPSVRPAPIIRVIPAGVDPERVRPFDTDPEAAHVVVIGPLTWAANVDAAAWFATEIWPRIAAAVPGARCTIAGAHPPRRLLRMASPRLDFPGFVEDYDALLASATVMAVPLRVGGGMRLKLLEFFAREKAVVSTTVGAEGNAGRDGEHYLRADAPDAFAAAVVALLRDEARRRALGTAARALVERVYSWDHIGGLFENAYLEAIERHADTPGV